MTQKFKDNILKKALDKRNTYNSINGVMNWAIVIGLTTEDKAIELRNNRAKELGTGKFHSPFTLNN